MVERRLCVVGLPNRMAVKRLEVDSAPRLAGLLGANNHPVAPADGRADRDRFDYPKSDVLVEAGLHSILPVDRDGYGRVGGNWASVWVDHQAHRTTSHHGEELVVTNIEGAAGIVCKQPLFESSTVLFRGRERQR